MNGPVPNFVARLLTQQSQQVKQKPDVEFSQATIDRSLLRRFMDRFHAVIDAALDHVYNTPDIMLAWIQPRLRDDVDRPPVEELHAEMFGRPLKSTKVAEEAGEKMSIDNKN